ncbi:ATP-binding cassette sub-family A member 3-like [Trichosurus vulpecula]|uniref:ATP-binding cassette sub-family A member 3-like n=1 Tax=Trichosurus vulpecula TaxID=9337 RepID=UPI00186B0943|nr:ATP-binding cassette sub-family A member 3-like [Trichosurus vulpecula]
MPRNLWHFWKSTVVQDEIGGWHTDLLFPIFPDSGPRNPESDDGGGPGYFAEGFLTVQHAVDRAIMRYHARNAATDLFNTTSVFIKRFPFPATSIDHFPTVLTLFLPLTILFVFSLIILSMIRFVVWEKENRLKEYLRIMGISNLLLWSSYFFIYFVFLLFTITFLTVVLTNKIVYLPIIHHSEGSLVFFFLMCSAIVSIFFSFMISTFFSTASTAAAVGGFLYFITYLPYLFIRSYYGVMTLNKKLFSCLLSNVAILLGIQVLIVSEVEENGIQWAKLTQPVTRNDNLTFGHILGMLVFDSFFYALVTWYIEAVFPGRYGIPQPWYFFLMKSYWFRTATPTVEINIEPNSPFGNPYIEEEPVGLEAGIQTKHLSKVFTINQVKKYAVSDLTMNFYKGQITVLLGHNGAGKTTTLSMLTGMYPPTSGEAYICGYEISTAMVQIRESMSFCPQYDILFDHMTVADHLYFYAQLKGLTLKESHKEIDQILKIFSLEEKRYDFSQSLTASMKRKLSISIAFLGDSKVIILDEPTSRMDPVTRRITWDLFQDNKHGHTIVLTTHNMDEADVLGDRIAIMAKGELQCCGSSLFLKHKYGAGYHMIIVKELHCDAEEIRQIVLQYVPNATLNSDLGAELSFILPKESTNRFEVLFTELENKQKDLGIASFGVSVTTMEEVFLRVGKLVDAGMDLQAIQLSSSWNEKEEIPRKQSITRKHHIWKRNWLSKFMTTNLQHTSPMMLNTGWKLYYQQFHAMLNKRAMYCWRNWKMTLIHILAPLVFTSLSLSSFNSLVSQDSPALKLDLSEYDKTIVPFSVSGNTSLINKISEYLNIMLKSRGQQPKLVTGKLEDFLVQSKSCIEHCIVAISLEVNNSELIATALFNNQAYHSAAIATAVLDNILFMLLSGPSASIVVSNKPQPVSVFNNVKNIFLDNSNGYEIAISLSFGLSTLASAFSLQTVSERVNKVKHMQFVAGVYVLIYWLSALIWDLFNFFIPCLLLLVVFKACDIEVFYSHFMGVLMIFMLYGWSIIPLMYLMSFFFLRSAAAYTKLVIFNFFSGWASFLFVFLIQMRALNFGKYAEIVSSLFLVLPGYNLAMAISGFHEFIKNKKFCALFATTEDDCREYGSCQVSSRASDTSWTVEEAYFNSTLSLTDKRTLSPGEHAFHFQFLLPTTAPTSSEGPFGKIVHQLQAVINTPHFCKDHKCSCVFSILSQLNLNSLPDIGQPNEATTTKKFSYKLLKSGSVILTASTDLRGYVVGQVVQLLADIENQSGKDTKPMVASLLQKVSFKAKHRIYDLQTITEVEGSGVKAWKWAEWQEQILVPALPQSVLPGWRISDSEAKSQRPITEKTLAMQGDETQSNVIPIPRSSSERILGFDQINGSPEWKLGIESDLPTPVKKMEFDAATFPEDEDVAKEREKVLACPKDMISSLNSPLVIRKLTKIYYKPVSSVAVDKLSLTVQKGECLGLLGFSGAGKTTTIKMLTGDETITYGDAFLENHSICRNIGEVRKIIGYCPQFSALLDHMTGREMLMMYARLRGIPESHIQRYADQILRMLLMEAHSDKITKTYSGGTKQKLSNAIALIGFPSVIFLDEPSTGMDPVARRLLWDVITRTRESGKAIVLSSHSMEECEVLCTRLAIMANGKLQCLGSPQYLKNKFSKGYTLMAKIKRESMETELEYFKKYIMVTFPGSTMIQEHQGMVKYHIPSQNLSWAKVFGMLENIKEKYNLEDYSICQTTLEQVFMSFANLEEMEEE